MTCLYVAVGGFIGAVSRYIITEIIGRRSLATMLVNIVACLLLGMTVNLKASETFSLALQAGFIGSFSTFSAFIVEDFMMLRKGERFRSILYLFVTLIGGYIAFVVGVLI